MADTNLRDWLEEVEKAGKLMRIDGADWDLEIGGITELNHKRKEYPALLFDKIKGYPAGYRVVTGALSAATLPHALGLPVVGSDSELVSSLTQKLEECEKRLSEFSPKVVKTGTVLQNVQSGDEVDLLKFPTPKWHELDGGRYIGTGHALITKDPDEGWVNLGTYRVMVQNRNTVGLFSNFGKHGRAHIEKCHQRGQPCPVAISVGHHPILLAVGSTAVQQGTEYQLAGALMGKPIKVIQEEVTGLPIPADSEIVLAGFCPPGKMMDEGPFGEYTGYYAGGREPALVIDVKRVYHRDNPIILGCPPAKPPNEHSYFHRITRSSLLYRELTRAHVPGLKKVLVTEEGNLNTIVISIEQKYPGHVKKVAMLASNSEALTGMGKWVIVVDEDIDVDNWSDVIWAMTYRVNPEKQIDITRRARGSRLDPMLEPAVRGLPGSYFESRVIVDACKPYEWKDKFPETAKSSPEFEKKMMAKWGAKLKLR